MNNYKQITNKNLSQKTDLTNLKNHFIENFKRFIFGKNIYEFSSFEMNEIDRINQVIEIKNNEYLDDNMTNEFLSVKDSIAGFEIFAFDKEKCNEFNDLENAFVNENHALNFSLKSLKLQKKHFIENYDLSSAVKIGDKIIDVCNKIEKQKNKINKIKLEILESEISFYNEYLAMLNEITKNKLQINTKTKNLKSYSKNVNNYFRFNKIIFYINSIKSDLTNDDIVEILYDDSIKESIGEIFGDLINGLKNVGTNL